MATSIKIDESLGLQSGTGTGDANDLAENQAVGSIILTNGEPFPTLFDAALAEVTLATGQTDNPTVSLSGFSSTDPNGLPVEIAGFGDGTGVQDIGWTDGAGAPLVAAVALDTNGNELLTTAGNRILLYTYTSISNNILLGFNEDTGTLVFAAYLDTLASDGFTTVDDGTGDAGATSVKIWMVLYEPIDHPITTNPNDILTLGNPLNISVNTLIDFDLTGAPSGQNLFLTFGDGTPNVDDNGDPAEEVAIVVTGKNPINQSDSSDAITSGDTVNTSKGGGEITIGSNNQMIDPGEGMYFTFVKGATTGLTVPNLDQNEADVEANIQFNSFFGAKSASFEVVQLQPPKQSTLKITALDNQDPDEKGGLFIDGLHDGGGGQDGHGGDDDVQINITSVTIIRDVKVGKTVTTYTLTFLEGGGSTSEPPGGPLGALDVDFTGNTVTIEGAVTGDRIIYSTGNVEHNRVLIENIGNTDADLNAAFDIGGFRLETGEIVPNPFHQLGFVDDGPTAAASLAAGVVRHDETAGNDGDADDVTGPLAVFAGVATVSTDMTAAYAQGTASVIDSSASDGGADGLASTTYSLAVFAAGVDSGLDTTEGQNILLYKEGALVVGRISGGPDNGEAAFAVAIDSTTGVLSMVQYHSIKHPTGGASHDESISVGNAALFAVATVTDGDGDPNSAQVDIGANVRFQDDGPIASAALAAGQVRHDETTGNQGDADDVTGPLAAFAGVSNVSTDMTAGYALGTASVIDSSATNFGQDGDGGTVYSLAVSAAGADSGLDTTEGQSILLFKEGDLVVGRISGGPDDGEAAFAVAINASTGVLSMVQYHSIKHPTGGASHDESLSVANGVLFAVATVTDGDGDTHAAQVDIGARVSIQDDGPTAAAALGAGGVAHDETTGNQVDANDVTGPLAAFAGVATVSTDMTAAYALGTASVIDSSATNFGQDGDGGTVYSLAVSAAGADSGLDTTEGQSILLYKEGALVVGRIAGGNDDGEAAFAVAINASTGVLSMVQYHSIKHPTGGASHDESLSVANGVLFAVATVTDGDGDTHAAQVDIGARVSIQDDGPTAAAALGAGGVAHDETTGNQGDANDVTGPLASFAGVASVSTDMTAGYALGTAAVIDSSATNFGQDGDGGTVYSLAISAAGADSGLDTTDGRNILLYKEGDLVVGRISGGPEDGKAAFAVVINASTGVLSMVQYHSIKHPTGGASHDESLSVTNGVLFAVATVTDGDGDTHAAQVDIGARVSFQDDGPTLSGVLDSTNSLVFASTTSETKALTYDPGADDEEPQGVALIDFTDPDDAADLAASGLDELEAHLGVDITAVQTGNTVTYYTPDGPDGDSDPDPLFTLAVTDDDWTFTIHQDPGLVFNVFDFSSFKAGGPVETIALEAGTGGTFGVFDGLLFGPLDAPDGTESRGIFPPTPDNPGAASTDDDLNPDELGFGIRQDAASNMNNNEGFMLTFHDGSPTGALTTVEGVQFKMDQQGNTDDVVMSFELINGTQGSGDDPDIVAIEAGAGLWIDSAAGTPSLNDFSADDNGGFWVRIALPTGNNDVFFTILDSSFQADYTPAANELVVYVDGTYDTAMYRMAYPTNGTFDQYGSQFKSPDTNPEQVNDSVRIKDITLIEVAPIPDITLSFEVQGTDGDGDTTQTEIFNVFVSEDGSPI